VGSISLRDRVILGKPPKGRTLRVVGAVLTGVRELE
jgi:hypothetical protein